jgi:hypothetical protein
MAKVFPTIDDKLKHWLSQQHLFFVATAPLAGDGLVNCSPKGLDAFRVLDKRTVAYLDLTGSGVETISHVRENGRMVLMFCSFDKAPRIVRLHGQGRVAEVGAPEFEALLPHFKIMPGMRAIIVMDVQRIADSCGFGVPYYEFKGERTTLTDYWERKGDVGVCDYQRQNNVHSLDGLPGLPNTPQQATAQ